MSDGGKGSSPRPFSVSKETFDDNWNRIFKKEIQTPAKEETFEERLWQESLKNLERDNHGSDR